MNSYDQWRRLELLSGPSFHPMHSRFKKVKKSGIVKSEKSEKRVISDLIRSITDPDTPDWWLVCAVDDDKTTQHSLLSLSLSHGLVVHGGAAEIQFFIFHWFVTVTERIDTGWLVNVIQTQTFPVINVPMTTRNFIKGNLISSSQLAGTLQWGKFQENFHTFVTHKSRHEFSWRSCFRS